MPIVSPEISPDIGVVPGPGGEGTGGASSGLISTAEDWSNRSQKIRTKYAIYDLSSKQYLHIPFYDPSNPSNRYADYARDSVNFFEQLITVPDVSVKIIPTWTYGCWNNTTWDLQHWMSMNQTLNNTFYAAKAIFQLGGKSTGSAAGYTDFKSIVEKNGLHLQVSLYSLGVRLSIKDNEASLTSLTDGWTISSLDTGTSSWYYCDFGVAAAYQTGELRAWTPEIEIFIGFDYGGKIIFGALYNGNNAYDDGTGGTLYYKAWTIHNPSNPTLEKIWLNGFYLVNTDYQPEILGGYSGEFPQFNPFEYVPGDNKKRGGFILKEVQVLALKPEIARSKVPWGH